MRGDESLAFGAVARGDPRPNSEFAFHPGIRVDGELKDAEFLVAIKQKREFGGIDFDNCP